ncbi:tetratricopeptide repeat protein [Streptomyces sp. P9-A2]|uniref:tetratricopeptide repeat protein n=1 Tax=Streptomyces sp. P9-A2 TaxID=3072284 RepID=UPI002FCA0A8E
MSHTAWGGAEDDGATVGDPSAVFEQAVAAYTQGRFAIAISHLRRLERAAAAGRAVVDARHAALRGALAARAQNWAECCDWYERSLAFSLPGDHARQQTLLCFHEDCTGAVDSLCGQCDRWFCPEHGAEREDGVARCGPCLDVALHNLAQSATLADRVGTAIETLASWAHTANWGTAKALLACLAPEEAADLGEQADVLDSFAPDRRAALLLYRASRTLHPTDLERACVPEPGASDSPLPEAHEWLRPWAARRLSRTGRHVEAWRARYEEWLTRPVDTAAVHALALAALRVFDGDTEADDQTREEAARQAVACWAMVLHSVSYWEELERHSGSPLTADERKAASDALTERIRQTLRDDDRAAERPPVDSLELAWEVELAVAQSLPEAMEDVLTPLEAGYDFSFGPGFLDLLSSVGSSWKTLVASVHSAVSDASLEGDATGDRLEGLLSPEGRYLMLLEPGRFDDVIVALEAEGIARHKAHEDTGLFQGPWRVLGAALLARAYAHAEAKRWSAAVRDFEDAAAVGISLVGHEEQIGRAGVHAGFALSKNCVKVDWQAYVGLLERVLVMAPQHEKLKRNLAAGCVDLGEQVRQRNAHDEARVRFARAYELDPSNESAVAALNASETSHAERLLESQSEAGRKRAVAALRAVLDRDGDFRPARRALVPVLYEHSLDSAVEGDRAEALSLMREARLLSDPSDDDCRCFSEEGPECDIAHGLFERVLPPRELDEEELRETLDILGVVRSYAVLQNISDIQAWLLADLAELLCADGDYDGAIALACWCPSDVGDRSRLDAAVAEARARRARRRPAKSARIDARSPRRDGRTRDTDRQLPLFGLQEDDQLW